MTKLNPTELAEQHKKDQIKARNREYQKLYYKLHKKEILKKKNKKHEEVSPYMNYSSLHIWAHTPLERFVHQYLSLWIIVLCIYFFRELYSVTGEKTHSSVS